MQNKGNDADSSRRICGAMQRDLEGKTAAAPEDYEKPEIKQAWDSWEDCMDDMLGRYDEEVAAKVCGKMRALGYAKANFQEKAEEQIVKANLCTEGAKQLTAMSWDECIDSAREKGADDPEALCGWLRFHGPNASAAERLRKVADNYSNEPNTAQMPGMENLPAFDGFDQCVSYMVDSGMHLNENDARSHCRMVFQQGGRIVKQFSGKDKNNADKYFIKAFLISASTNLNVWGVTPESLPSRIGSFMGKPLVMTEDLDHPKLEDKTLQHALDYQESYKVGTIVDITTKDNDTYYATIEVTDPKLRTAFEAGSLPLYVSPGIAKLSSFENDDQISNWVGVHLALVDDPAYTIKHALITNTCAGDSDQCLLQLRKAHIEKHGSGCGFCIRKSLLTKLADYVSKKTDGTRSLKIELAGDEDEFMLISKGVKSANDTISSFLSEKEQNTSERNFLQENNGNTSNAATTPTATNNQQQPQPQQTEQNVVQTPTANSNNNQFTTSLKEAPTQQESPPLQSSQSQPQQVQQQQPQQQTASSSVKPVAVDPSGFFQADYDRVRAENEFLKHANNELKVQLNTATAENTQLRQQFRRAAIENIIKPELFPDANVRAAKIDTLVASNMTPDDIAGLYSEYAAYVSASSNSSKVTVSAPQYHSPAQYKVASLTRDPQQNVPSQEQQPSGQPDLRWLRTHDYVIRSEDPGATTEAPRTSNKTGGIHQ